jgi:hypothetical protein
MSQARCAAKSSMKSSLFKRCFFFFSTTVVFERYTAPYVTGAGCCKKQHKIFTIQNGVFLFFPLRWFFERYSECSEARRKISSTFFVVVVEFGHYICIAVGVKSWFSQSGGVDTQSERTVPRVANHRRLHLYKLRKTAVILTAADQSWAGHIHTLWCCKNLTGSKGAPRAGVAGHYR